MKYMVLIYSDPATEPAYGSPEFAAMLQGYGAFNEAMAAAGALVGGHALQDVSTAKSVRVRAGKVDVMDGPFAATKERLGGYYLLECADIEEAARHAALIPTAVHGTIEIRPIAQYGV